MIHVYLKIYHVNDHLNNINDVWHLIYALQEDLICYKQ